MFVFGIMLLYIYIYTHTHTKFLLSVTNLGDLLQCGIRNKRGYIPVPGGPYRRTPLGGWIPRFSNLSL